MQPCSLPLAQNPLLIPSPEGQLEAVIARPALESAAVISIICHPHPLHGGSMQNKVVSTLARVAYDLGIYSVRFNFRGVGNSTGVYANGIGEAADLLAIVAWVQQHFPAYDIWLAGFSFGAYIAMQGAAYPPLISKVKQLVTVAPAVNHFEFPQSANITCPWLLVMGEKDEIVPVAMVKAWAAHQPAVMSSIYFPEAGHFFHGHLTDLREKLKTLLLPLLATLAAKTPT